MSSLDIKINPILLNDPGDLQNPVDIAVKKFESHPSILAIKNNVEVNSTFEFSEVTLKDMTLNQKTKPTKKWYFHEYSSIFTKGSKRYCC